MNKVEKKDTCIICFENENNFKLKKKKRKREEKQ